MGPLGLEEDVASGCEFRASRMQAFRDAGFWLSVPMSYFFGFRDRPVGFRVLLAAVMLPMERPIAVKSSNLKLSSGQPGHVTKPSNHCRYLGGFRK